VRRGRAYGRALRVYAYGEGACLLPCVWACGSLLRVCSSLLRVCSSFPLLSRDNFI
jgi:hypothetical protein